VQPAAAAIRGLSERGGDGRRAAPGGVTVRRVGRRL